MRKCPRCGHDVNENEKYCPHCGLDLRGRYIPIKQRKKSMNYIIYAMIIFSMVIVPLFYSRLLNDLGEGFQSSMTETTTLPTMKNTEATSILAYYETLADFQKQFTNVDGYVKDIETYTASLPQDYNFDKKYFIVVYDNYNVSFSLKYSTKINDHLSLKIEKFYDIGHTVNEEKVIVRKSGVSAFEELFLTDEENDMMKSLTGEQTKTDQLMDQFRKRQAEFEQKKETLGHFGIGEYDERSSFVVYRNKNVYDSELTYVFVQ